MPVALLALDPDAGFAPIARPRFLIGSDLDCDLVDGSPDVAPYHAKVRILRGEYVLVAMPGCSLWVGEDRFPLLTLRDGDKVAFAPGGVVWQFRSRVEGSFWPPEYSVGEAWIGHPAFRELAHVPADVDWEGAADVSGVRVASDRGRMLVLDLGPVSDGKQANAHLRFLSALGGAAHPNMAAVLDGGVMPRGDELRRWLCVRDLEGATPAAGLLADGPPDATRILRALTELAQLLAHLHQRGIVLRNLTLKALRLGTDGQVWWDDFSHAHSLEGSELAPREDGDVPPGGREPPACSQDVFQFGVVGAALLLGDHEIAAPPPDDALAIQGLEDVVPALRACLAEDPAHRPEAANVAEFLTGLAKQRRLAAGERGALSGTQRARSGPRP